MLKGSKWEKEVLQFYRGEDEMIQGSRVVTIVNFYGGGKLSFVLLDQYQYIRCISP
jgi:hypothetical protein